MGNPYASAVNWDASVKTGLSTFYYVWDPTLNTRGAYAMYGSGTTNPAGSQVDQNIQGGEAFFVQTTAANASLTFNENNKTTLNRNVFRSADDISKLSVQLLLDTTWEPASTADGITVLYGSDFKTDITSEDAAKLSNLDENVAILRNGFPLSLEARPSFANADTVQLAMDNLRHNSYFLKFDAVNFSTAVAAVVKDNFLKKDTILDLSSPSLVAFSITNDTASYTSQRFTIILKSPNTLPLLTTHLNVYRKGAGIQVEWAALQNSSERFEIQRSVDAQPFYKQQTISAALSNGLPKLYDWYDNNVGVGNYCYQIVAIQKTGDKSYSNIACINLKPAKGSISIYPNPVVGRRVNLNIANLAKGIYKIKILNNAGQSIFVTSVNYKGTNENFSMLIGNGIMAGSYRLQLSGNNETFIKNVVID